jgi:hypothetical protein
MLPDLRLIVLSTASTFLLTAAAGLYVSTQFAREPLSRLPTNDAAPAEELPIKRIVLSWPSDDMGRRAVLPDFSAVLSLPIFGSSQGFEELLEPEPVSPVRDVTPGSGPIIGNEAALPATADPVAVLEPEWLPADAPPPPAADAAPEPTAGFAAGNSTAAEDTGDTQNATGTTAVPLPEPRPLVAPEEKSANREEPSATVGTLAEKAPEPAAKPRRKVVAQGPLFSGNLSYDASLAGSDLDRMKLNLFYSLPSQTY